MNQAARLRGVLVAGIQTMELETDEYKIECLLQYQKLLEKWSKVFNLSSIGNPIDVLKVHFLDSLSVANSLFGRRIADVGTGAGLPGIPLAIFFNDKYFYLIDSNSKKTRFVQQVIIELKLENVEVIHGRVEDIELNPKVDVILTRAFSSLLYTLEITQHLLSPKGELFAMKGCLPVDELRHFSKEKYSFEALQVPGVTADRYLIRLMP